MLKKMCLLYGLGFSLLFGASKCPDLQDLQQHNGHFYGITSNTMTFDEAKKFAESKGGYLAIPNTAAENTFLKSILGGRKGGWLGVYDPSYSSSYSYSVGQKKNSSRFRDIKGNALSYAYWESSQPDNLVEEYDTYNGQQRVSPLGEHWVAMDGNSGKWWDYGNHFDYGNARFYALLEFNSAPTCFEDLSSNVVDTFTNKKCSTQIWDSSAGNLEAGAIFDCRTDSYGNTYCPSSLAQCAQQWDYDSGYSVAKTGSVIDYANKIATTQTTSPIYGKVYYSKQIASPHPRPTCTAQQAAIAKVATPVTDMPSNSNPEFICFVGHYDSSVNLYISLGVSSVGTTSCPAGHTLSGGQCSTTTYACPAGYADNGTNCKKTVEYSYYNYLCSSSINTQGFNYAPANTGGNCNKTDPNNSTSNPELSNPCNSPTPPANNCKREKFTCQANSDRPCSFVDNKWQCSPFPCMGGNDVTPEGTIEGTSDKNNNGWSEDGMCNGQIYIFNGKDRRCRSWDMFFGLVGGGCCDKDKVFMGLVGCKENEKMLAKQNKAELCTELGEYCSKKIKLGFAKICVQKSKGHCCFGSKLARFVHEQGRSQLGISWGTAENPQCRGFTPEEFQKLDFSKIDLTGAFDIPEINQTDLTNKINSTVTNFKNMLGN